MDLDQILPQLLTGESPKTTGDLDALKHEYGISAVLCLQTDNEFVPAKIDWGRLEAYYRESEVEIRRIPVRDCDPEGLRRSLPECVRTLDGLLRDGHKVYVHCGLGMCRAPTVILAYLQWVQDWDFDEAIDYVTACRACSPQIESLKRANDDRRRDLSLRTNAIPV